MADTSELPDIVHLQFNEDGYWTNLPLLVIDQCKQGRAEWQWGNRSIGASDLALNILEWAYRKRNHTGRQIVMREGQCFTEAFLLRYDFKMQVVAQAPLQGRSFTVDEVWDWIDFITLPLRRWQDSRGGEDEEDNGDDETP